MRRRHKTEAEEELFRQLGKAERHIALALEVCTRTTRRRRASRQERDTQARLLKSMDLLKGIRGFTPRYDTSDVDLRVDGAEAESDRASVGTKEASE